MSKDSEVSEKKKVYGVTEVTRMIKTVLEQNVGSVWIEGELSNLRQPASGHMYFTLKDASAQISGVMFRGSQRNLSFTPADGVVVRVQGEITVYEARGNYQIIVRNMEEGGKGALQEKFEALKKKLFQEGLFDEARKKKMPLLPRRIGVVTSSTGAAIRDILNVINRRFPNVYILLAPVKVQGNGAAEEIAEAIDLLDAHGGLDVLIVGRGGGSLEDLWCFNEEVVARAIARCSMPVISAVGHEIDFTISDFVADLRAPTPSAAAELVVGRKDDFEETISEYSSRLIRACRERLLITRNRVESASSSYVFREPGNLVKQYRTVLESRHMQMVHKLKDQLRSECQRVDEASLRILHNMQLEHQNFLQILKRFDTQLTALSPLAVLERGYSVTCDNNGRLIKKVNEISSGEKILTRVSDGAFESEVL